MHLRIARHTNQLPEISAFYTSVLGLTILGEFKNHNGYDGIFLGTSGTDWHLEFTSSENSANHTFDEDDLLVFYPATEIEYQEFLNRLELHKIDKTTPKNPYWLTNGITFHDPDGYGIVISHLRIQKKLKLPF